MASPVASAFVLVKPDLSGFAAALQAELNQAVAKVKPPPIKLNAQVMVDDTAKAVRSSSTRARKAASEAFDEAGESASKAKPKVTAYEIAVKRLAEATEFLATSEQAGVGVTTRLGEAETQAAAKAQALAKSKAALGAAIRANNDDLITSSSLLFEQARAQDKLAKANLSALTAPAKSKAQEATGFAALSAAQAKAKEAVASREVAAASAKTAAARLSESASNKAAAAEAAKLLAVTRALEKARLAESRIATAGVGAQTVLQKATLENTAARKFFNLAIDANNLALATNDIALKKDSAQMLANGRAAEISATQRVADAKAAQQNATRLGQASRGAIATAASFGGLRGAVLAATGPFIAATIAVTAFAKAVSAGAQLEESLNVFQATAGATADQMERVSAAAISLGKDVSLPGVAAGDAAITMTELSKAGLSVEDSIAGARGVLLLATAAQIDFASASELAASALNSFGLGGDQAGRVADVFAAAANAAQGSIQDFALANQQVDAVARQVGLSLEDTTTLLAELAKNGLRGSDAGTSLRTALVRLIAPTSEARTLLDQLGVSIRDAQGNVDPLVFARFGEATANLAPDLRDAVTAAIFGQDAIRAVAIAAREGVDGFQQLSEKVNESGKAQELADARSKGLTGSARALGSALETLGGNIGTTLIPALMGLTDGFTDVVNAADAALGAVQDFFNATDLNKPIVLADDTSLGDLALLREQVAKFKGENDILVEALDKLIAKRKEAGEDTGPFLSEIGQGTQSPFAGIDDAIKKTQRVSELGRQLSASIATFAATGFKDDAIRASILSLVAQLEAIGGPQTQQKIQQNMQGIANVLGSELQSLAGDFGVTLDDLSNKVPDALKKTIAELAKTPAGREILKKYGTQLSESLAEGIDEGADKAVESARKAVERAAKAAQDAQESAADAVKQAGKNLASAIEQANNNLIASVTQGRNNLRSIGDSLASQVGDLIEVGPLAQKAKALTEELDKVDARLEEFRRSTQQGNLERGLTDAQTALDRQRDSLITLGQGLSGAQKAKLGDLLAPAQQKVDDATAALQEFNLEGKKDALTGKISDIQALQEAAKTAATDGVQALVEQLRDGTIDAGTFAGKLNELVEGPLKTLKGKDGKNLGLRFSTEFLGNLETIIGQAQALAQFVSIPSPSTVVDPAVTRRQGRENVADTRATGQESIADARSRAAESRAAVAEAQANLNKTITENAANAKKTASATERSANLLAVIAKALEPKQPNTTKTGGPGRDNNASVKGSKVKGG